MKVGIICMNCGQWAGESLDDLVEIPITDPALGSINMKASVCVDCAKKMIGGNGVRSGKNINPLNN